jgi:hypothetical protein
VAWLIVVIGVVVVIAVVAYFAMAKHPEDTATHGEHDRQGTDLFHPDNQGPAGPGAEDDGVGRPGQSVPGPSADDLQGR